MPQVSILFFPMDRTQQQAAIRKHLRLAKLHGDGERSATCKALVNHLPGNQLIVSTQSDMCLDGSVLPWIKPAPDGLDHRPLSRRQE